MVARVLNQGFGGQVIEIVVLGRWLCRGDHLRVEQMRQTFDKLEVHRVFVFRGVLARVEQYHALLAVGRAGHEGSLVQRL
ncbi:hypothetical protein D3C77_421500 [compost metagenome]